MFGCAVWSRSALVAAAVGAMCVVSLVGGVSVASAGKAVLETMGGPGTGPGQFTGASGVAVNQGSGDVYVVDAATEGGVGGQRILRFSAAGEFLGAWGWGVATGAETFEVCTAVCGAGTQGSGEGQFSFLAERSSDFAPVSPQIAVDQVDGSVYLADNLNARVQKFSADGAYLDQFGSAGSGDGEFNLPQGVAVDPVSQDVYVADTDNNRIQRFSSAGVYQSQIGTVAGGSGEGEFLRPRRVAVDSLGRLYVLDTDNFRVQRFSAAGTFDSLFGSGVANVADNPDLAIDPASDHVFIAAYNSDFSSKGIVEVAADGAGVDLHAGDAGFAVAGLAVRSSTGRIYASDRFGRQVMVVDDVAAPTASISPVTEVTATGATFNGSINPQGPPTTSYHFEYSTDGGNWTAVPSSDVSIGSGTSDVAVSQAATGLEPNTEYRVRLVATKAFNAASVTSSETTFSTTLASPLVRRLGAGNRTDTAAWLASEVNPQNSPTSYYFEYGRTEAYGSRVPTGENVDIGAGNAFVLVQELVEGLDPATVYHFRVVAINEAGTTNGPDHTFRTRSALPAPPPGRAYEMVSPLDKNGGDVDRNLPNPGQTSTSGAAVSGDVVAYSADAQFAGIGSGAVHGQYRSVRGSTSWTTRGINPPVAADPSVGILTPIIWLLSDDLSRAVVSTNAPIVPAAASLLGGSWGLYLQDNRGAASSYELLAMPSDPLPTEPPPPTTPTPDQRFRFAAASPDLRHIVFESVGRQLTPDGSSSAGVAVYAWNDGQVSFVSELPSGEPAVEGQAGASNGSISDAGRYFPGDNLVSDDGKRVYFIDGIRDGAPLYVRENGTSTEAVSVSERAGDPATVQPAVFRGAKANDGSLALFTSNRRLTEDATACDSGCSGGVADDLYLWNALAAPGERLTDLTTGDPGGGGVLGIAAIADDLSHVYFVATGELAPGGIRGRANLYLWTPEAGVRHVAALGDDGGVWSVIRDAPGVQFRDARLSADGSHLLFASRARLTAADNGGHKQLYLYDATADRLTCVSCTPLGSASQADARLFYRPVQGPHAPYRLPRNLSADGKRVFFETDEALVLEDTNAKSDVYQWADGELSLISTGKAVDGAEFVDADADGTDVFFTTRERLVGSDVDDQVDIYDARVDGGFPSVKPPPPCVADQCRKPFSTAPELPVPGGAAAGDLPAKVRASLAVSRLTAKQRRALVAGQSVSLAVRVNKAGRVTARGMARVGERARVVLAAAKRARRAGKVVLPLRLSAAGHRQLLRSGRLRVALRVRFADADEPRTLSIALAATGRGKGR